MDSEEWKNQFNEIITDLVSKDMMVEIKATGMSMFPFIKSGDNVIIQKSEIDHLKSGDIIVFKSKNKLIAHRLIRVSKKINEIVIISKGDYMLNTDRILNNEDLIGKVIKIVKSSKTIDLNSNSSKIINRIIAKISLYSLPLLILFRIRNKIIRKVIPKNSI